MTEYWYEAFIGDYQKYCLLDDEGTIRATAPDLDGILLARKQFRWGKIFKFKFSGKTLKIGKEVKVDCKEVK